MPASDDKRKRARRGYTLVELLIVISLMGILAAILLPRFEPSVHDQLQGAAQILAADLNYARNLAVTNDSRYRMTYKRDINAYSLQHTGTNNLLDVLPLTPYRNAADAPNVQTTRLEDLPNLGTVVEVVGIDLDDGAQARGARIGQCLGVDARAVLAAQPVGVEP